MNAFLDTSVLVASFYADHQHHGPSIALLSRQKPSSGCTAVYCLAECYAATTGMPGKNRASPGEALMFLRDVRDKLDVVALDQSEHFAGLENAVAAGVTGGTVYDALIVACALKARARTIFTWNARHFRLLGGEAASRTRMPE